MIIGGRAHNLEEVEKVAKAGFPFSEVSFVNLIDFQREVDTLKILRDKYGIFYLAHGPEEGNPWEPDILRQQFLPLVQSLLGCAAELSSPVFTVHFWVDHRFISSSIIAEKISILKELSSCAADYGITLCLENLSENYLDFSAIFDNIQTISMTLDIGHGELLTKKNTSYGFAKNCMDRIGHLHLHDNMGGNTPEDDLHLPLGEGIVDFPSILYILKKGGYNKTITLEVKPQYLLSGKKIIEKIWDSRTMGTGETSL